MRHHLHSTILALFLLAGVLAVGCTPAGSGATTAPGGTAAPAGSIAPSDGTGKGGYGY